MNMHHLIIGYGYCGYHLALQLLQQGEAVTAVSRHRDEQFFLPKLTHQLIDIAQGINWSNQDTVLYYLAPPLPIGNEDHLLEQFLHHSQLTVRKVIYFGSSAVYGNQQGQWVDEQTPCPISHDRQQRRLHAEQQWQRYCQQADIDCVLLRVAGIYGANRLPIAAARQQAPLLKTEHAPWTNLVYVNDLIHSVIQLAKSVANGVFNIADGNPQPMGTLQRLTAQRLNLPAAPQQDWQIILEGASEMKQEFMQANKRLSIDKLRQALGKSMCFTPLEQAIEHILSRSSV